MDSWISIIFFLVIINLIVKNLKSSKKSNKSNKSNQSNKPKNSNKKKTKFSSKHSETPVYTPPVSKKKKSRQTSTPDVLQRAKQNVAEDFEDKKLTASDYEEIFGSSPTSSMGTPTASLSSTDSDCHTEPSAAAATIDVEDLLKQTQDLIVLGYHAKLPYERDFIAEGMAIIDQYKY